MGFLTRTAFALGAASTGIQIRALSAFLLIFYNQAIGLSPLAVSTAILIVMVIDAALDPIVGFLSDRLRTPWGRRHPLMYVSAAPLALGFFLLWNPPATGSETWLFWHLLICLILVRAADTLFELPSAALVPELSSDFHERTRILSTRTLFRTAGSLGVTIVALQVFIDQADGGLADREGYAPFSLAMATTIFVTIIVSAAATQRFVPFLHSPPDASRPTFSEFRRDVAAVLANRAALVMIGAGIASAIAVAARGGLEFYIGLYFWRLTHDQLSTLAVLAGGGALAGALVAPVLSRVLGKTRSAIACYTLSLVNSVAPIALRLAGAMPANGTEQLMLILSASAVLAGLFYVLTVVMMTSMLADVVEEVAVKSGRRAEGVLFSTDQFFSKATSGLGVVLSGLLLSAAGFPAEVKLQGVRAQTMTALAALYVPSMVFVTGIAIALLGLYNIDRARHERNVDLLAGRTAD